ncbi:MAG: hypothetical protein SCH66_06880 [Methanolobus sp.]|nr:hypothetical protein [Methanolobus sp.]
MLLKNILLPLLIVFLLATIASAELPAESAEISYQIEHSDRIAIGNVTEIQEYYDHSIVTVEVQEWLMNPISNTTIKIYTKIGTNMETEDETRFTVNETAILMLTDTDPENNTFRVTVGEPGKHPLSDRDATINEIREVQDSQNYRNPRDDDDEYVEYPPNPVTLSNGSDYAYDMDDDGKYDYLVVTFDASTTEPGNYSFGGDMQVFMGTNSENGLTSIEYQVIEITRSETYYLDENEKTISINFEGGSILENNLDGPFEIHIDVNNESWGFGEGTEYTTKEYNYSDFEMPDFLLDGPVPSRDNAMDLAIQYANKQGIEIGELEDTEISRNIWHFTFEGKEYSENFFVHGDNVLDVEHFTLNEIPIDGSYDVRIITGIIPLVVFFAAIILVFLIVKKTIHEPNSRNSYLLFFLTGIFTFYLSGYILRGIDPPKSIYLMFLVFIVLTGTGIFATGEKSGMFIAKAFAISFAALIIISVLFFAMSAFSHMYSKTIDASPLQEKPDDFVVVTEEELNKYPALKKAIETQSYAGASSGEWERTIEFLNGTSAVQYKDKYYGIGFLTA